MVAPLPSRVQEPRPQDHHSLARALLQLNLQRKFSFKNLQCHARATKTHLNPVELLVDDEYHPVDLLGRDGPHPRLLPQKVHHMCRELLAALGVNSIEQLWARKWAKFWAKLNTRALQV